MLTGGVGMDSVVSEALGSLPGAGALLPYDECLALRCWVRDSALTPSALGDAPGAEPQKFGPKGGWSRQSVSGFHSLLPAFHWSGLAVIVRAPWEASLVFSNSLNLPPKSGSPETQTQLVSLGKLL